jgi:hypothetical protein
MLERHYLLLITMIVSIPLRKKYGAPFYDLVQEEKTRRI